MIQTFRQLLPDQNYEYLFDPYWVSAYPYRADLREQPELTVQVTVRNFRDSAQSHRIALRLPKGLKAEPELIVGQVPPRSRATFPVKLIVTERSAIPRGVQIVPMDITLDDHRYGELFDFITLATDSE
jgi:hypothetical protein